MPVPNKSPIVVSLVDTVSSLTREKHKENIVEKDWITAAEYEIIPTFYLFPYYGYEQQ